MRWLGLEINLLGLVADSWHKMLHSLSATKPNSSISKPRDDLPLAAVAPASTAISVALVDVEETPDGRELFSPPLEAPPEDRVRPAASEAAGTHLKSDGLGLTNFISATHSKPKHVKSAVSSTFLGY